MSNNLEQLVAMSNFRFGILTAGQAGDVRPLHWGDLRCSPCSEAITEGSWPHRG